MDFNILYSILTKLVLFLDKLDKCSSIQDNGLNLGLNPSFPP